MIVNLLGSSAGGADQQFAMSYVVNGVLAIDAGCLGLAMPLDVQRRVEHVFLSHSHVDHIASLPLFIENVYRPGPECPTVYGSEPVLESLRRDVFNDRVWPDMLRLAGEETPFMELVPLESGRAVEAAGMTVTPITLDHIVPTLGFLVDDGESAVAFVSDTAPTDLIWEAANRTPHLKGVFLEASFPESMEWLAVKSKHLTPRLFAEELRKLRHDVPVVAVHIKAAFRDEILRELEALGLPRLQIASSQTPYSF